MIDRTPAGYTGPTVAYLAGEGHVIRCETKASAAEQAQSEWPQYQRGEHMRGPTIWIELVPAAVFDREQAEDDTSPLR